MKIAVSDGCIILNTVPTFAGKDLMGLHLIISPSIRFYGHEYSAFQLTCHFQNVFGIYSRFLFHQNLDNEARVLRPLLHSPFDQIE